MTNNSESSDEIKRKNRLSKWLADGIDGAVSDSLKAILLPLFIFIIFSGLGFVLFLNSIYIRIAFEVPAYQVGLGIGISVIIVFANQKRIRRVHRRLKWCSAYGFLWKTNNQDKLSGPHCSTCKAHVVEQKSGYEMQMKEAFGMIQGKTTEYMYKCANPSCRSKTKILNMDMQTLIQVVYDEYYPQL